MTRAHARNPARSTALRIVAARGRTPANPRENTAFRIVAGSRSAKTTLRIVAVRGRAQARASFSSGTPERPSPRLRYIRSACADNKMNDSQMQEEGDSPRRPESPKNCWYDELYPLGLPVAQASLSTCPVSLRSTGPVSLRSTVGQASRSTCGSGFPERLRKIDTIQNQCRWLRGVESLEPQKGSGRASEKYERVVWMRKGSDARRRRPPSGPRQEAASADRSCVPRHGRVLVQPVCFITVPVC
jgi:hypothetical protein